MKLTVEFDREETIQTGVQNIKSLIHFFYKWLTTDEEILGHILAILHFMICSVLYILIIICHIYPDFWFQLGVFICVVIVWLQHILLKVCISFVAETEFVGHPPSIPLFEVVLDKLGISLESFTTYFVMIETVFVAFFSLEILSRISYYIYKYYDISV